MLAATKAIELTNHSSEHDGCNQAYTGLLQQSLHSRIGLCRHLHPLINVLNFRLQLLQSLQLPGQHPP
jgi:hypothetical protein